MFRRLHKPSRVSDNAIEARKRAIMRSRQQSFTPCASFICLDSKRAMGPCSCANKSLPLYKCPCFCLSVLNHNLYQKFFSDTCSHGELFFSPLMRLLHLDSLGKYASN
jgi:hypothetical protein